MKVPYDECVGQVRGVWVRAYQGKAVTLGVDLYTKEEALELARLLTEAASKVGPKATGS